MRYLLTIIMALFLAAPAYANSSICKLEGPHNCTADSEAQLQNLTINTINHMQLAHKHAFKTENDRILEKYARNHAQLQTQPAAPSYLFLNR